MQAALDDFTSKDLMLFLDSRYLSLALPENPDFELLAAPAMEADRAEARSGLKPVLQVIG